MAQAASSSDGSEGRESSTEGDPLLGDRSPVAQRPIYASPREAAWANISNLGVVGWVASLQEHFGWRLLVLIFVLLHSLNGFVRNLVGPAGALPYLFRSHSLDASVVLIFQSVLHSIWVMAPLIALATDFFPIGGYKNAPITMISSLIGTLGCLMIFMVPELSSREVLICLVLLQFQQVAATVCCTGTVVRRLRGRESHGADLQTFVSFGIEFGGLVGNIVTGPLVHFFGPHAAWGLAALPASAVGSLAASGFFEETRVSREQLARTRDSITQQREVTFLALALFVCTLFTNVLTLHFANLEINLISYAIGSVVLLFLFQVLLNPSLGKVAVFSILVNMSTLNIDSAMFYFLTDTPHMYPDGPHLSVMFFNSVRGPVCGIFALVGIFTYNKYMKGWSYRKVVTVSQLSYSATVLSTLIIVTRLNVRLGIPDTVFVLVHSALRSMTMQWTRMPFRVLFMFLCPTGMEATMYSLLKGTSDFGNSVSDSLGAGLLSMLGCKPNGSIGEQDSFQYLYLAIIVTAVVNTVASVSLLPLVPAGEPNRRLVGGMSDATSGSLWNRWLSPKDEYVDERLGKAAGCSLLEDGIKAGDGALSKVD